MLHIAICDDEQSFVTHLTTLLNRYAEECSEKLRISVYYDGQELLDHYDTSFDLIFLDIQMDQMNGLTAAGRIREIDAKVGIIFLTTLVKYGLEGYKYQAINYIIKPIKYIRLKAELNKWLETYRQEDAPSLIITNDSGRYKISLKSLRYVETFHRNLMYHTAEENIICYKSMKEAERELAPHGFVRCHTSYLVNLFYIKGVKKLEIQLVTGETLPISQPKRKTFMEQMAEYWGALL